MPAKFNQWRWCEGKFVKKLSTKRRLSLPDVRKFWVTWVYICIRKSQPCHQSQIPCCSKTKCIKTVLSVYLRANNRQPAALFLLLSLCRAWKFLLHALGHPRSQTCSNIQTRFYLTPQNSMQQYAQKHALSNRQIIKLRFLEEKGWLFWKDFCLLLLIQELFKN